MAQSGYSDIDATVVNDAAPSSMSHKGKERADALDENAHRRNTRIGGSSTSPSFVHSEDYFATNRPFCVKIGADGLIGALTELDNQLQASGRPRLLSRKKPTEWLGFMGEEINPGEIGVVNHAGLPKILMNPGTYPPFPFRLAPASDALAYATTTAAKAQAEAVIIAAEAQAAAIKLQAQAEAEAVTARSNADSGVEDAFAREMEVRRVDVERVKAFGPRAVFVPCETGGVSGSSTSNALMTGMAMRLGHEEAAASASSRK